MRKLIAGLIAFAGWVLAIWVGIAIFIAGLEDLVDGAKADPTNGAGIAWGLVEAFVLAAPAGIAIGLAISFTAGLIGGKPKPRRRPTAKQVERDYRQKIWKSRG